ncbi:MAG: DUF1385 domain-containing protein [Anaerolineae bacterium]|nr:DUF1385 domain-containing protein [Anaerolineae bacterium]
MTETKYDLQSQPVNEMQFSYGGQAVIEGVLMRGAHTAAIAVRAPDGQIVVHEQPLNKHLYRGWMAKQPFVRGLVGLYDALGLGTRALMWSADVAMQEPAPKPGTTILNILLAPLMLNVSPPTKTENKTIDFNGPIGWAMIVFSLVLGLGLFMALPNGGATLAANLLGIESLLVINLLEGVIQLAILVVYIWLIGLMPDTKRLFGYHGAEHKTINAYEAGGELTPENVAKYPIEHPRCGTAFLLTVVFIGMLVFAILDTLFGRLLITRLIFIPVVAGISYEVLRFTAKNITNPIIRLIVTPNLMLQHLTTRQPDLQMIEVAIVAFKRVLHSEGLISAEEAAIPEPTPAAPIAAVGD